jgi:hypothetical protein
LKGFVNGNFELQKLVAKIATINPLAGIEPVVLRGQNN